MRGPLEVSKQGRKVLKEIWYMKFCSCSAPKNILPNVRGLNGPTTPTNYVGIRLS